MKKPNIELVKQYIFEGRLEELKQHWHLTDDDVDQIINHTEKPLYYYNTMIWKPLSSHSDEIAEIISKHYNQLHKKYIGYIPNDTIRLAQTSEDIFHTAIIRTMETELTEVTVESVLKQLDIEFYTAKRFNLLMNTENKKSIQGYEFKTDDNKTFIPSDNYAVSKQTQEGEESFY